MPIYSILLLRRFYYAKVVHRRKQQHVGKQWLDRIDMDESLLTSLVAQAFRKSPCFFLGKDLFSHAVLVHPVLCQDSA